MAGWRRGAVVAATALLVAQAPTGCDEQGRSTVTGQLNGTVSTECSLDGQCDSVVLAVSGSGFAAGSTLRIHLPGGQVAGVTDIGLGTVTVGGSGTFEPIERRGACTVVDRPGDVPPTLSVVADDVSANVRRGITWVASSAIFCRPPFVSASVPYPCGSPDLCPTLTVDSASTIGVHWVNREAGYDTFRVRYAPRADTQWTETRELGGDVAEVAVNNLEAGVSYEFELLACHTHLLAASDCTGWTPVGTAAT